MAQKTEVEIGVRDKATTELRGIQGAFEKMRVSVETNNKGINKLDNALRGMGAQAASLPGPLGRVADALADFAPGGLVGAAYLAGFGAMIMIGKSYFDSAEKSKKITQDLAKAIADLNNTSQQFQLKQLLNELDSLKEKSESSWRTFWLGSDGRLFGFGESNAQASARIVTEILKSTTDAARNAAQADQQLFDAQQDRALANAEGLGRALEEKVKQAAERLKRAQAALTVARQTGADETVIIQRQAAVEQAYAEQTRARKALLDKQTADEEKSRQQQRAEERLTTELLKKELDARFRIQMKYYEDLANARQLSREFIGGDIGNTIKTELDTVDKTILGIEEAAKKAQTSADERMKSIEPIVYGISDGFDTMIDGLMSGENAFKSFGQGARSAISGILKALAQQNLVEGLGALGKAFAAAANPLTAPSAPGFFKSAAQHFAAAAAAGVGARAVGGAGGGGIGANGGAFNNSQLGRNSFNNQQQPLTIVIQGGLLDMSNPDTQRSFVGALETVTNRRIKVNTMGI